MPYPVGYVHNFARLGQRQHRPTSSVAILEASPVGSVGFSSWVLLWSAPTVPCGYVCRSKLSGIGCPEAEVKRPILSVGIPGKGFLRDDTRVFPKQVLVR